MARLLLTVGHRALAVVLAAVAGSTALPALGAGTVLAGAVGSLAAWAALWGSGPAAWAAGRPWPSLGLLATTAGLHASYAMQLGEWPLTDLQASLLGLVSLAAAMLSLLMLARPGRAPGREG